MPASKVITTDKNMFKVVIRRCSIKKVFLKISQNSQENVCARFSFLIKTQVTGLQFYQKETPVLVFFCEFC